MYHNFFIILYRLVFLFFFPFFFVAAVVPVTIAVHKMEFSIKDFSSKCDQIRRKLRIWSNLLKKSLMENFIFCAVSLRSLTFRLVLYSIKLQAEDPQLCSKKLQQRCFAKNFAKYLKTPSF